MDDGPVRVVGTVVWYQAPGEIPTITPPAQNLEKYVGIRVRFSML